MSLSKPIFSALGFYFSELYEHPVRTKAISCCLIATAGNYVSQQLGGGKFLNYHSLVAYGVFGLLFAGPIPHYFYEFVERLVPEEAKFITIKKLFLERLIYSPLYQAFTLYTLARLEGKSHQSAIRQMQALYWVILRSSWKYLTVLQLINLSVVPPMLRIFITNIIGFFWTIYIANKRREQELKSKKKGK